MNIFKIVISIISITTILYLYSDIKYNFTGQQQKSKKVDLEWTKPERFNQGLPDSIQIFQTTTNFAPDVPLNAFYAQIDLSDKELEFKVVSGDAQKRKLTPEEYAQEQSGSQVVLNGGFFNMDTGESQSLIIENYDQIAGIETNQGQNQHPSIGAFGMYSDRTFEAVWAYSQEQTHGTYTYKYPEPNPTPEIQPNTTYPQGAEYWNIQEAIGAGPLLLKNSVYYNGTQELFNDYILDERHPRSAICKKDDNTLILMAIDGRTDISIGLYLNEVAEILSSIGCTDAINLDGGGSTCLYANDQVINNPSGGSQRPVSSAVMIYKK